MSTSDVIVLLMPVLVAVAWWLFRWLEQRLPEKQRAALEYFAKIAVHCIEQKYDDKNGNYKKSQAVTMIYGLFQTFRLPTPNQIAIDAAIEALVWEMNQAKLPDDFVTTGKRVNTGPIKPILPDAGGQPA